MSDEKIDISVQYQPLRKGAARPEDWGSTHGYVLSGGRDVSILPNVGDFISLQSMNSDETFHGRVRSRLFSQFTRMAKDGSTERVTISVNIVVEETDDDWGKLIKE